MIIDVHGFIRSSEAEIGVRQNKSDIRYILSKLDPILSQLQERDADWAELVVYKSGLQITLGEAAQVVQSLSPLLQPGGELSQNIYAHITRANALIEIRKSGEAVQHLERLVQKGKLLYGNKVAHITYARALQKDGQPGVVISHLSPLLKTMLRSYAVAHVLYANALIKDQQAASAAKYLKPFVDWRGWLYHNPVAQTTYANALIEDGRAAVALQHLRPFMRNLLKEDPVAQATYATALIEDGNPQAAARHLRPMVYRGGPFSGDPYVHDIYQRALRHSARPLWQGKPQQPMFVA